MTQITKETKEEIRSRFPRFAEATRAFYAMCHEQSEHSHTDPLVG